MIKRVCAVGLCCVGLIAASAALAQTRTAFSPRVLNVDGVARTYLLHIPSPPPTKAPVVFLLHGHGGNAADLVGQGRTRAAPYRAWLRIAAREKLVLVAPEGLKGSDGKQGWNDCRGDALTNPRSDDVAFLSAIIDAVGREAAIDRQRVFVAGTSNGGHMALRMAIENKATAVAAIVAAMPARSQCAAPVKAVPVLFMNGTDDPLLPYAGGAMTSEGRTVLSTEASVEIWRRLAGITDPPQKTAMGSVTRLQYAKQGLPRVVLYRVEGGGHTEPSRSEHYAGFYKRIVGPQNEDIEMADEVWNFFAAQGQP